MAIGSLTDLGLEECRAGQLADGERDSREALHLVSAPGQPEGLKSVVEFSLATCMISSGAGQRVPELRWTEADKLLDDVKIPLAAATEADPNWGGNVELARAELALNRKQYSRSSEYLAKAKPYFDVPGRDLYQRQAIIKLDAALRKLP